MASHSGVLATDRPYSGIMATIYDANSVRKDVDITNDKGRYSFTGLVSGPHQIRFFGRFYTEDDYIDVNIIDTDLATSTVPLTFVTTPTLSALETGTGKIDGSNNQLTTAQLTFANLSPSTGALTSIIVLFKPSFETTYEDKLEFKFAKEMTEVTNNGANAVFTATLPMFDEQQTTYDFKAQFVDQQGDVVIISNLVLEVTAQATFNGVSDFAEYIHVDGLEVKNIKDSSDNSMGDNTFILQWTDFRELSRTAFDTAYPSGYSSADAFGTAKTVTWEEGRRTSDFGVFMFVSTSGSNPSYQRPGTGEGETEANGIWYFMGDYSTSTVQVSATYGSQVGFWVGMRNSETDSTVKGSTESI